MNVEEAGGSGGPQVAGWEGWFSNGPFGCARFIAQGADHER